MSTEEKPAANGHATPLPVGDNVLTPEEAKHVMQLQHDVRALVMDAIPKFREGLEVAPMHAVALALGEMVGLVFAPEQQAARVMEETFSQYGWPGAKATANATEADRHAMVAKIKKHSQDKAPRLILPPHMGRRPN